MGSRGDSINRRRGKVEIRRAHGFLEDEVWSESNGAIACSRFGVWSERRCGEAHGRWGGGLSSVVMVWEGDLAWWKKIKCREKGGGFCLGAPCSEEGGGGVGAAWRWPPVGSGLEPVGARGVRVAVQNRGRRGGCQVGSWQQCGAVTVEFISNSNSNRFQIKFKSFQNLADLKMAFPSSKNLKQNMVVKVLKKGTTLSIGISLDLKWILN
jgi:hypothetical protein